MAYVTPARPPRRRPTGSLPRCRRLNTTFWLSRIWPVTLSAFSPRNVPQLVETANFLLSGRAPAHCDCDRGAFEGLPHLALQCRDTGLQPREILLRSECRRSRGSRFASVVTARDGASFLPPELRRRSDAGRRVGVGHGAEAVWLARVVVAPLPIAVRMVNVAEDKVPIATSPPDATAALPITESTGPRGGLPVAESHGAGTGGGVGDAEGGARRAVCGVAVTPMAVAPVPAAEIWLPVPMAVLELARAKVCREPAPPLPITVVDTADFALLPSEVALAAEGAATPTAVAAALARVPAAVDRRRPPPRRRRRWRWCRCRCR